MMKEEWKWFPLHFYYYYYYYCCYCVLICNFHSFLKKERTLILQYIHIYTHTCIHSYTRLIVEFVFTTVVVVICCIFNFNCFTNTNTHTRTQPQFSTSSRVGQLVAGSFVSWRAHPDFACIYTWFLLVFIGKNGNELANNQKQ